MKKYENIIRVKKYIRDKEKKKQIFDNCEH